MVMIKLYPSMCKILSVERMAHVQQHQKVGDIGETEYFKGQNVIMLEKKKMLCHFYAEIVKFKI